MQNSELFQMLSAFNFQGISFVSLKGYSSDKSGNTEVADHLINVGVSYSNLKKKDLAILLNAKENLLDSLTNENFGKALIEQAIDEKIKSIVSPNENRSTGQKEALIHLNNGVAYCPNTDSLLITGIEVRKTVHVKGEFKEVKSRPLTIAKKYIDKALDLNCAKVRRFALRNLGTVKVSGETFEIS